jgi:hypothetical protein
MHTIDRKNIICNKLYSFEMCKKSATHDCDFAHTYEEYTPNECQYGKSCTKGFCGKYHKDAECKCKYLMRMGRCPSYFWNYHCENCIKNELISWVRSEFTTSHDNFCEKLRIVEKYHCAYKAVIAILLNSINIRDATHACNVINELVTFPENMERLLDTYCVTEKDIFRAFIETHNAIIGDGNGRLKNP